MFKDIGFINKKARNQIWLAGFWNMLHPKNECMEDSTFYPEPRNIHPWKPLPWQSQDQQSIREGEGRLHHLRRVGSSPSCIPLLIVAFREIGDCFGFEGLSFSCYNKQKWCLCQQCNLTKQVMLSFWKLDGSWLLRKRRDGSELKLQAQNWECLCNCNLAHLPEYYNEFTVKSRSLINIWLAVASGRNLLLMQWDKSN